MAAVCDICAKKPGFGNNRPWSRKITKRRFNPNIQRVRATVNGTPKRMNVCTGCLMAGKVSRCRRHVGPRERIAFSGAFCMRQQVPGATDSSGRPSRPHLR